METVDDAGISNEVLWQGADRREPPHHLVAQVATATYRARLARRTASAGQEQPAAAGQTVAAVATAPPTSAALAPAALREPCEY